MKNDNNNPIYSRDVIELVTVAVEYCAFVEQAREKSRKQFTDVTTKILPLLYLKAVVLPQFATLQEETWTEDFVTEADYDYVRAGIATVMAEKDDYLDVFVEDMKYSESPILATVSENLADLYQVLKNFAMRYKNETSEEDMLEALAEIKENFRYEWGQKLVNVLRALHEARYSEEELDDEDDE